MKWIKRIAVAVIILVVVAALAVHFFLDSVVRTVIVDQSNASLNVPTTLAAADIAIFGGNVSLADLEIGSPPSFSAPHVFTLGGVAVAVDYGQLRGNPIHIKKITIDKPALFIEQSGLKLNLQAMMDQIPQAPPASGAQPGQPMKLIIDELDLNNAQVTFLPGLPGLTAQIPISVPSMTLTNIGNADGNQNGAAIKQVVMQVVTALASKAGDSAQLPPELKALLSTNLAGLSQQVNGLAGSLTKALPGDVGNLLNNKGSGNPASQAQDTLKGLFGGKKQGQ